MYQRKEKANNSYYPSFLCMEVVTPDFLDAFLHMPYDERTEAAFLHEYIHYLQDLTTLTGYARIEIIVDQIKWFVGDVARKNRKIQLPLTPISTCSYNLRPNALNLKLCKGDFKLKNSYGNDITPDIISPISFELENAKVNLANGGFVNKEAKAVFKFADNSGKCYEYVVGELAISESMAYLIENRVYPNVLEKGGDCPYMVVKKITEFKLGRVLDDLILIAICDVCLMYPLPGRALYFLIEELQTVGQGINPFLIYILGLGPKIGSKFNEKVPWSTYLSKTNGLAKRQMLDYFVHPYWKNIETIVKKSFEDALDLRIRKPIFFLDIACGGPLWMNKAFIETIGTLGCLSVKTSFDRVYNFPPRSFTGSEVDSDWFLSLHQFYNMVFTNDAIVKDKSGNKYLQKECELKQWCHDSFVKKGDTDITEESYNCKYCPWQNILPEQMKQCSFGRLWGAFDLTHLKVSAQE